MMPNKPKIRFRNWKAACNGLQIEAVDKEIKDNPTLLSKASSLLFNDNSAILVGNTQIHQTGLAHSIVQWEFLMGRVGPKTVKDFRSYTTYATYSDEKRSAVKISKPRNKEKASSLLCEGAR